MTGRLALGLGERVVPDRQDRRLCLLGEPSSRGSYRLSDEYVTTATDHVARQFSKAGVRLAFILNKALRR